MARSGKMKNVVRPRNGKDSGVAEIIGTVLIFAIAISLFTTFIMWYVPSTGTANEQHYYENTQAAFYKFANELSDSQAVQGQSASYSFPTGISGVPPFSPSSPTSISFSKKFDNFSASISFSITVTYTNASGSTAYYNSTQSYTGGGVFTSSALTQFTTPTSYVLQDGFLIQEQGQGNPANAIGPLPISANLSTGGSVTFGASLYNVSGPSTTVSSVGSTLVTLYYSSVNRTSLTDGTLSSINGTIGRIDTITLNSFYYNVTSLYVKQWNYAMYQQFNSSSATYLQSSGISSWNFNGLQFAAKVSGQSISISSTSASTVNSLDVSVIGLSLSSM